MRGRVRTNESASNHKAQRTLTSATCLVVVAVVYS